MKNYYEVLQVNKTADKEIIQKVYKILTKKYHPDLQQNDEEREYAEKACESLKNYGYVNDERYAQSLAESLVERKGMSIRGVKTE
mgnify:CR=1 FL=1